MKHEQTRETHPLDIDWAQALRSFGLRATPQRVAALTFLDHHPHADAEEIFKGVQGALPTISLQAVHLIVRELAEKGVIRRVDLPDSASARYETRVGDNHHHIQCVRCGRVEDVDCVVGQAPCLNPSHSHGMRVIEADVTFRGICNDCERKQA